MPTPSKISPTQPWWNRDPRWGRNGEGGAEDPYLMGAVAASFTRGFQFGGGDANSTKHLTGILTLKHYVANSLENTLIKQNVTVDGQRYTEGDLIGRHTVDVHVSNSMLQNYLAAFRAAAKAGAKVHLLSFSSLIDCAVYFLTHSCAKGMMCSYNEVNGIPTCLSPMLKKARELWTGRVPWGGYITSDSDSVADAYQSHHYVSDPANASCMAVRDGGDDVDSGNTYYSHLADGVKAGFCTMNDVDAAVRNTLTVRFELGLFDGTGGPLNELGSADVGTNASAELNLRATAESLVLLRNKHQTLPLKPGKKIAVVGPHANASRFIFQVDNSGICGGDGTFDCVESPYQAIKRLNVGGQTTLAVGCDIIDANISTPALKQAAVAAATAADIVVLAIGIAQCWCIGTADSYMGGKATNPGGCATSVVPP